MEMIKILVFLFIALLIGGCAGQTKFQKQCQSYGFGIDSADYSVCIERETKKVRDYLDRQEAEEKAKSESFYRDLERKRLGLDVK